MCREGGSTAATTIVMYAMRQILIEFHVTKKVQSNAHHKKEQN